MGAEGHLGGVKTEGHHIKGTTPRGGARSKPVVPPLARGFPEPCGLTSDVIASGVVKLKAEVGRSEFIGFVLAAEETAS